jgi:endonuclease YncB( thermonuclease family)
MLDYPVISRKNAGSLTSTPRRWRRALVTVLIAGLTLLAAYLPWQPAPLQACRAVDGDTIHCGEQRVRLIGLDAPELRGRCEEERRLAEAATERLRSLLEGGVTLEQAGEDRFGRVLAVVRNQHGQDLADVLIREGLARAYHGRGPREGWC